MRVSKKFYQEVVKALAERYGVSQEKVEYILEKSSDYDPLEWEALDWIDIDATVREGLVELRR